MAVTTCARNRWTPWTGSRRLTSRPNSQSLSLFPDNSWILSKLQIFVVGDKTSKVNKEDGTVVTLEEDLKALAKKLGLPFMEIP